jgi:hypothetical protein
VARWRLGYDGTGISRPAWSLTQPSWYVEATGDFNNDGRSDIVLQNNNGNGAVWNMDGDQISPGQRGRQPGPSWQCRWHGRLQQRRLGMTDIALQNNSGAIAVWDMDGFTINQAGTLANPGPAWSVIGDGRHSSLS